MSGRVLLGRVLTLLLVLALAAGTLGCTQPQPEDTGRIQVVASIMPLGDFAKQVGQERVEVHVLLPSGASPHSWEPTPRDLQWFSRADLFIENGGGLEFWAEKVVLSAAPEGLRVINASEGIHMVASEHEEDAHHVNDVHHVNPHVWLDPLLAKRQVENIRDALIAIDPENATYYTQNAREYLDELDALHYAYVEETSKFKTRTFITFHPAWTYMCMRYNLTQIPIEESPGKEPSPAYIASIIKMAEEHNAGAVFAEPQFNPQSAHIIAEETGLKVLYLDPLGDVSNPERNTYIKLMRYNLAQLSEGLK
ncbi:metal ABC transporter solute-binding protein, Zn/Mn family [Methermicoccus shengliensis]|uniref:Zinc ABC transporter substrate-binding protein n=1 Tax=Methermicoccus shengliensis TaxID=660064 RepID=A0A832RW30_9EURY|nr:zinc ABC transporter substrate-binding protein [Methermicoccus shengliensis]